jgi:hypothetical protein
MLTELYDKWEDEETAKKKTHKREWAKEWLLRRVDKATRALFLPFVNKCF